MNRLDLTQTELTGLQELREGGKKQEAKGAVEGVEGEAGKVGGTAKSVGRKAAVGA